MQKIRILSENLANQIAAGEVVERPASVVKELVENAIDAGASRISVDVELGGRRSIKITDNGQGMVRDDAILAFERHATSKIRTLEDLGAIQTLGFRGEALASIASVARVELISKSEQEAAATRVVIDGGRLIDVKDHARDTGTTIAVRDLFFNTPARRKFMRSEATENYHIASIVTHYALAHPEIAFRSTSNGREVVAAAPAKNLRERAFQIFGAGILESMLPVSGGREYVANVSGFISAPRERRTNRDSQYFFVNQRFVRDKTIAGGLLEGYRSVLPHGVYPIALLFLDVPPEEIDVNVHPAKTEIRFRRNEAVKDVITEAIREALANAGIVAQMDETNTPQSSQPEPVAERIEVIDFEQNAISFEHSGGLVTENETDAGSQVADEHRLMPSADVSVAAADDDDHLPSSSDLESIAAERFETRRSGETGNSILPSGYTDLPPVNSAERFVKRADVGDVSAGKIRPIPQLHDSFIIAVDDEGLLLIDQHVAHERILFDKFRNKEFAREVESQNLLLPETFDLTPPQAEAFQLIEDELADLGFGVMRLSGRTVAIRSIPTDLPPSEARNLLGEILDNVELEKRGRAKSAFRDDIAASLACKAAVKINMKLTSEKMHWLIERLLTTSSPTTCPHGRPVILRLTMKDIERGFHRT